MTSDKKIWNDLKNGKSYALSHIYYQNVQLLFRYGKKFVNDDGLVKDTIQDLFYDIIRSRKNLGETDNILFYLMRSFRRKLFRNIKKQNLLLDANYIKVVEAKITFSVEQELIQKEELSQREKAVQEGLSKLSPKQREILFYRYTCEFEYDHICSIMQINYDTARKQVHRALRALKQVLNNRKLFLFFLCNMKIKNNIS